MPRATGPAADAATPESAEATTPSAPDETTPPATWGHWRYLGDLGGRVYTNVPVTVHGGEVIAWPTAPADDGAWEPTEDPVTTQPDNHRPEPVEQGQEG